MGRYHTQRDRTFALALDLSVSVALTIYLQGIFPSAIILIVATKRSFADAVAPRTTASEDVSNVIRFTTYDGSPMSSIVPSSSSQPEALPD